MDWTVRGSNHCRSRWPNCLRRGPAADRLLGLRLRIPLLAWIFVLSVLYSKDKSQDSLNKETSMDKVQRANKRIKKCPVGRDFPRLSIPALGPTQPPIQWVSGLFAGVTESRAIPLFPLWAFMANFRANFTSAVSVYVNEQQRLKKT
jgi:hypothetical protein